MCGEDTGNGTEVRRAGAAATNRGSAEDGAVEKVEMLEIRVADLERQLEEQSHTETETEQLNQLSEELQCVRGEKEAVLLEQNAGAQGSAQEGERLLSVITCLTVERDQLRMDLQTATEKKALLQSLKDLLQQQKQNMADAEKLHEQMKSDFAEQVKNKAPHDVQITAEQLLREATVGELDLLPPSPEQKRKGFEDNIRKNRTVISNWIKYAQWEESLKEIQRARSIYCGAGCRSPQRHPVAEVQVHVHGGDAGNVTGCRQVFERWMEWEPDEQAWHSYINFELR
ncbi:hypothetical protein Q5P01_000419 [Channa striata]|uniref:Uncharacterized protein n=1 Tax=Channa striata TaxID=64152 RepID=A0AA88IGD6_CHASR|nr:hypothetical protein Q5P01_000419 [Channa striata]